MRTYLCICMDAYAYVYVCMTAHACVYTRPTYSDDIAISVFRRRKVTRKVAAVPQFVTVTEKKLQM